MITVQIGDLLTAGADALVCPTNTAGPMGAGLAKTFAQRFPGLERDYRAAAGCGKVRAGVALADPAPADGNLPADQGALARPVTPERHRPRPGQPR